MYFYLMHFFEIFDRRPLLTDLWKKKQKYFWIRQKYIETSVSNPPRAVVRSLRLKDIQSKKFEILTQKITALNLGNVRNPL